MFKGADVICNEKEFVRLSQSQRGKSPQNIRVSVELSKVLHSTGMSIFLCPSLTSYVNTDPSFSSLCRIPLITGEETPEVPSLQRIPNEAESQNFSATLQKAIRLI